MSYFPMFIDLEDRQILVVGAGVVGGRRIEALLSFGALLTVVEAEPSERVRLLAEEGKIKLAASDYRIYRKERRVAGSDMTPSPFFMVLAATGDRTVDQMAAEDGRAMNAFVNVAGDKGQSDFYFPGIAKAGDITAGITAGGNDHSLAKRVTNEVETFLKNCGQTGAGGHD